VHALASIYERMCESKIGSGLQVWGLHEVEEIIDRARSKLCKKLMGLASCAANGFT
jgi:hypothetical protein